MISKTNRDFALGDLERLIRRLDEAFQSVQDVSGSLQFSSNRRYYDVVIEEMSDRIHAAGMYVTTLRKTIENEETEPDE